MVVAYLMIRLHFYFATVLSEFALSSLVERQGPSDLGSCQFPSPTCRVEALYFICRIVPRVNEIKPEKR